MGRVLGRDFRPDYDPGLVWRELEIIHTDLHCNAVKIVGRDLDRLVLAGRASLRLGLEVWFAPELWNRDAAATLRHVARGAVAAEQLRAEWPDRVVFSVGTELSLFMRGILPGRTFHRRVSHAVRRRLLHAGTHNKPLNSFLARACDAVRTVFHDPITYAALPAEWVDWAMFDIVGVDYYWHERIADRYVEGLRRWLAVGKPVVISEFGFRTHADADRSGAAEPPNFDPLSSLLHAVPGLGQYARPRVKTVRERDEALQARSLTRPLELLDTAGVDGGFVHTVVEPRYLHGSDPRHDLDADSFGLAKFYPGGRSGTRYPDLSWEPKQSFDAVADYYATH